MLENYAIAAELAGVALLLGYHADLAWVLHRRPLRTYRVRANRLRYAWVASVMASGRDILAVQTVRNWTMSATRLASTSILIGMALLGGAFGGADLSDLAHRLSLIEPRLDDRIHLKTLLLAMLFFAAFFNFSMTLRSYNHVVYMINLPVADYGEHGVDTVANVVNQGGMHDNQGMRMFLLATPTALWLIGPYWFAAGTLFSLLLLYRFDFGDTREQIPMLSTASPAVAQATLDSAALTPAKQETEQQDRAQ